MTGYELRTFSLPADLEDRLVAELWSLGALGFETREAEAGRLILDAYFPAPAPPGAGDNALARWHRLDIRVVGSESLEDRDWMAPYRAAAEPFEIGRTLRVDPGESSTEPARAGDGRSTLRIPARTAFGTGSHASTRLVLEWLEDLDLEGLSVLDAGTGSGVLLFASELFGAGEIIGFDLDAQAVCVARGNARLNAASPRLYAGGVSALRRNRRFDLALVNILPESFAAEIPSLAGLLKPGARVISSGNLIERRSEILARWQAGGFVLEEERRRDEWLAFLLRAHFHSCPECQGV